MENSCIGKFLTKQPNFNQIVNINEVRKGINIGELTKKWEDYFLKRVNHEFGLILFFTLPWLALFLSAQTS
jgi:hypothetical protein